MTILVSEIGINHDGDFELAKHMADKSFEAGADYVKLQMRTPELCVPKSQWYVDKHTPWGTIEPYIEYRRKMEFSKQQLVEFSVHTGGRWFPSVFDIPSLELALEIGVKTIKIPSAMLTNAELIDKLIGTDLTIILSTGMSTIREIVHSIAPIHGKVDNLYILHCNSAYPTPEEEINLNAMKTLGTMFPLAYIGFSSHATSPYPAIYAAVMGAKLIEVHFTLDRTRQGSDHAASLEFTGLQLIGRELKRLNKIMGDGKLALYGSELAAREKLRGN